MTRVVVTVMPRAETLDPQGQTVEGALRQLGFDGVGGVRVGKQIVLDIAGEDPAGQAHAMCERLLVNPLVEDYEVRVDG